MAKFNWSILDRNSIIAHMMLIEPILTKKHISINQFHKVLTNHIRKLAPIRFKKQKKCHERSNWIYVGGTYYSDWDQEKRKCIELVFEYSFFDEEIYVSKNKFLRVSKLVADTILHEIIHMKQYRSRKFKNIPDYSSNAIEDVIRMEQEYFGNADEIDAYSFNIACELNEHFGKSKIKITQFLDSKKLSRKRISPTWNKYFKVFEHNHGHPIIKKMKQRIIKYLPLADIGKPYKETDYINR